MATARFKDLCIDALDPESIGRFWADALGLAMRVHEHRPGVVGVWAGETPVLWVNAVDRPKTVKNRVHLDLRVPAHERLLELGARLLAEHDGWRVLADPEGNEFCAFPAEAFLAEPGQAADPPARPFALCVDSDRPVELAAWWAEQTAGHAGLGPGPDGTPRWLHGLTWGPYDLIWKFVPVSDERTEENRVRWDLIADPDALVGAGATVLRRPDRDISWTVLHDPQRNAFCVVAP